MQLNNTLLSIQRQGVKDCEVIVVDDGTDSETPDVCKGYGARYFKLNRPPSYLYREVGRPMNIAIRQSLGDILILQNAECKHVDPNTIEKLTNQVTDSNAVFARVISFHHDGSFHMLYVGKEFQRPFFFCGAIKKERVVKLRGIDEEYPGSGYEDDDFAARLLEDGVRFEFTDVEVHHQWHERAGDLSIGAAQQMYNNKCEMMRNGTLGVVRNLNHEWGAL
jgi:glycosyltransferase involved in cell wall biosynthesis